MRAAQAALRSLGGPHRGNSLSFLKTPTQWARKHLRSGDLAVLSRISKGEWPTPIPTRLSGSCESALSMCLAVPYDPPRHLLMKSLRAGGRIFSATACFKQANRASSTQTAT